MPGTLVSDAHADVTLYNATIASATTTNGSAVEYVFPQEVGIEVVTGTVTGTSVTADITIQGAADSGFTTSVVDYFKFDTLDEGDDAETKRGTTYIDSRYIRAVIVTTGTSPSVPLTIRMREPHYQRNVGTYDIDND